MLPHLDAAHNLARYLLRDDSAAADAVQDAYLRALRHFGGWRGGDARAWLLTIVRNVCRSARAAAGGGFDETLPSGASADKDPPADLARRAATATLGEGAATLAADLVGG